MNRVRKQRLLVYLLMVTVLSIAVGLVLYALGQNINLFYSPTQIALGEAPKMRSIRVGGMVVPGSLQRSKRDLSVAFEVTDYQHTLKITYSGILPDLFREGQGIVAEGMLVDNHHVEAKTVLAKHDENYMPPEVKDTLRKPNPK